MKYKGYTLKRVTFQGCLNYRITDPHGNLWSAIAANIKTAKRWIDAACGRQLDPLLMRETRGTVKYGPEDLLKNPWLCRITAWVSIERYINGCWEVVAGDCSDIGGERGVR